MPTPRSSSATAAANGSAAASRVARRVAASRSERRLGRREGFRSGRGRVEPARERLELLAGCGRASEQVVVVGRAEPAARIGDPLELALDLLDPVRLGFERGEEPAQVGAQLPEPQLDVAELLARAGQLRCEPLERCQRALGGRRQRSGPLAVLGRERLGRPLCSVGELGHVAKPLPLRPECVLPAGLEALRRLDERSQLAQTLFFRRSASCQLVVPLSSMSKRAPRQPSLTAAAKLVVAAVRVEHVELVRGPGESPLLELAGHRDQPLGGGREVLARDGPPPRIGARAAVGEDPARKHEAGLVLGRQLCERGQLLVFEEALGQVELRFHVGLAAGGADRPCVTFGAEQEADRLREDRLPRTGLAGDRRQSLGRRELSLLHEDEVLDPEATKQRPGGSG